MIERRFWGAVSLKMAGRKMAGLLVMGLLVSSVWSGVAAGSPKFSLGLFGGLGTPQKALFNDIQPGQPLLFTEFAYLKQKSGLTFGGRATAWVTPRLGVELETAYLPVKGDLRFAFLTEASNGDTAVFGALSQPANSTMFGVLINYALVKPALDPVLIYVSGGVGAVNRGGEIFDDFLSISKGTDIGVVVGVGASYGLSAIATIRTDLRDYITSYDPEVPDSDPFYQPKTQHDLFITAGLDFVIAK